MGWWWLLLFSGLFSILFIVFAKMLISVIWKRKKLRSFRASFFYVKGGDIMSISLVIEIITLILVLLILFRR